jgi:hypothetical protein
LNKKIKNATLSIEEGIHFRSILEKTCNRELSKLPVVFQYEKHKYKLMEGFRLSNNLHFIHPKGKRFGEFESKAGKECIIGITYTPDFVYEDDSMIIVIECKGYKNDTYPLKCRLFLSQLQDLQKEIYFFEPHTTRQIKSSVDIIKTILKMKAIKQALILCIKDTIYKKDYLLAEKFCDKRMIEELSELLRSIIELESLKPKDERINTMAELLLTKDLVDEYLEQLTYKSDYNETI